MPSPNSIVVLGPTASGKTRLACELAYTLDSEIISFDSRQVYKGLDVGTGKDLQEYNVKGKSIPYHLIDVCEPNQQFYLHDFIRELKVRFDTILKKGKIPILCGGTGLYLDVLRKDFSFTQIPEDAQFRTSAENLTKDELLQLLLELPDSFRNHVDINSRKRILRGIEVARYLSKNQLIPEDSVKRYQPIYLGIKTNTESRNTMIKGRLLQRLEEGMLQEAEGLLQKGLSHERMQDLGLEYKFLSLYLQNQITWAEMLEQLYAAICRYAKRQMTWFRKMEKEGVIIQWLESPALTAELISELKAELSL